MHLRKIVICAGKGGEIAYGAVNGTELHVYVGDGLALVPETGFKRIQLEDEATRWVMQDMVASGQE